VRRSSRRVEIEIIIIIIIIMIEKVPAPTLVKSAIIKGDTLVVAFPALSRSNSPQGCHFHTVTGTPKVKHPILGNLVITTSPVVFEDKSPFVIVDLPCLFLDPLGLVRHRTYNPPSGSGPSAERL
jgi:hypothetical protein